MKILSITAQKPHSTGSGVYLTELVKGFCALGCEQAVVAGVYEDDTVSFPEGVTFVPVPFQTEELPFPIAGMSDEMPYLSTRYCDMDEHMRALFKKAFLKKVAPIVKEFRPDVILCHHLYLLTAYVREAFPDCTVCGVCHGSDLRQLMKNERSRDEIGRNIRALDHIFALHAQQKQKIVELSGVDAKKITVVGSGFCDEIFTDAHRPGEPRKPRLIFAGKLSEKKGVFSLLRCIRYMPGRPADLGLCLAGSSGSAAETAEVGRLAKECPCPVLLPGRLSQAELAKEYAKSDVFVLPSFYEGLPLVVLEALACGLKVVCTDLPGIREWMEENVPGSRIVYVNPPAMRNTDEPEPESLPSFERRLALAVQEALDMEAGEPPALSHLAWRGICEKFSDVLKNL